MADEDSFGDDSFDTGRGGAGDDDFDDSFEGGFGGGPGDENPMTQVRRRSSAALSYLVIGRANRTASMTAPLAPPVRSRRWCRTNRTTRRWR